MPGPADGRGQMDRQTYNTGREIRRAVLGADYVDRADAGADEFGAPLQDLVTEYCWGAVWGRDGLDRRTRSMLMKRGPISRPMTSAVINAPPERND